MNRVRPERAGEADMRGRRIMAVLVLLAAVAAADAGAQDANVLLPVDSIEELLARESFEIIDRRGSRFQGDRTNRVTFSFPGGAVLAAKWARAARGGEEVNNSPRFELAAYEVQKLFLDAADYVVPPTVARAFPVDVYQQHDPGPAVGPTFRGTGSVLVVLQYWLFNVTGDDYWDPDRFASDTAYARHFGNFNVLTYLVRHVDENAGNYLISTEGSSPRVFAVDNGMAFSSDESDRGYSWRELKVDRLPRSTVERLRAITHQELARRLGTVAEFRIRGDGTLETVEPGENLRPGRGVRRSGDRIQLGLTGREIDAVWRRLGRLIARADDGDVVLF